MLDYLNETMKRKLVLRLKEARTRMQSDGSTF